MRKLISVLFTTLLFINCSDDDSNDLNEDEVLIIDEEVIDNDNPIDDGLIDEEKDLLVEGRWKLTGLDGEILEECDEVSYISFEENGSFEVRDSGSDGFSGVNSDDDIRYNVTTCFVETRNGSYDYNEVNNKIVFSYDIDYAETAEVTIQEDQLTLSYNDGDYIVTYKRESEDYVIVEENPLVAKWDFFSSANVDEEFVEVEEDDCYKNAYIIFGIEGIYVFDFPIDDNDQCIANVSSGEYTNNTDTITIISDTNGNENSEAAYIIEGEFLTIDQSGDGSYFERYKRSDD